SLDLPHTALALLPMHLRAHRADALAGVLRALEQLTRGGRGAARPVLGADPSASALLAEMLTEKLPGLRIDEPDHALIPLHMEHLPDEAGRRRVVGGLDLDAA